MSVVIQIDSNAAEIVRGLDEFPSVMARAVTAAMDRENERTVSHTVERRLSGAGPFPPPEHRLGVGHKRGGLLRRSLTWTRARISGNVVEATIENPVKYAAIHEYGSTETVSVKAHTRTRDGKTFNVRAFSYQQNMPERAPVQHGIKDREAAYIETISLSIRASFEDSFKT